MAGPFAQLFRTPQNHHEDGIYQLHHPPHVQTFYRPYSSRY